MSELNGAALLDKTAYTVRVQFVKNSNAVPGGNSLYTYITNIPDLSAGNLVIVQVNDTFHTAIVEEVDSTVDLAPGIATKYKWVAAKVILDAYYDLQARNKAIEDKVLEVYQRNLRRSFSQLILDTASEGERADILALLPATAP